VTKVRTEKEIRRDIEELERDYPPGNMVYGDAIGNYCIGVLAGLKVALGDYPSFVEMEMEEFIKLTFPSSDESGDKT